MADLHRSWAATTPPPGWLPAPARMSGPPPGPPERPRAREPHPIRVGPLLCGLGGAMLWMALFGALGQDLVGYAWWSVAAALTAWIVAALLAVVGDRGVAVGAALSAGIGWSIAATYVASRWISTGDWPMW